jgi:hypothetical protein
MRVLAHFRFMLLYGTQSTACMRSGAISADYASCIHYNIGYESAMGLDVFC